MPHILVSRARAGLALAGLVAVAGCGSSSSGDSNADPASVVPGSAPFYASIVVKPEGDQKTQLEAVLKKVMRTDDPGAKIEQLFDDSAKDDGVTYAKDVEPWIGNRVGLFVSSFRNGGDDSDFAVVMPASDTGKGLEALRKGDKGVKKRTYRDVSYQLNSKGDASVAVDDFVVGGSEAGVKAVIDTSKDSGKAITEDADYSKASAEAGKDSLVTMYLDPGEALDALAADGSIDRSSVAVVRQLFSAVGARAIGAGVNAQANGFDATFAILGAKPSEVEGGDGAAALAGVPGDSWLAFGVGNLGGQIDNLLKQFGQLGALAGVDIDQLFDQIREESGLDVRKDLLDWMGDSAFFVRGTTVGELGGGLIIKSKDPAATERGLRRLALLLRKEGEQVKPLTGASGVDTGFSVKVSGFPVFLALAGDRFIGAVGRSSFDAALKSTETLGDSPGYQEATSRLGDGLKPSVFFAMQPVLELVESTGYGSDSKYRMAKPYLEAFTTIVAGGKREGDVSKGRLVIGVK